MQHHRADHDTRRLARALVGPSFALAALGALPLSACGSGAADVAATEHPTAAVEDCDTARTELPPQLRPAPELAVPDSELRLVVAIPRARLEQALEHRIPEKLAAGSRRVSVGRLSYSVERGPIELGLDGLRLRVGVPIHIGASVCVPLGPMCPAVGGCSPALHTTVHIPLQLDEHYALGHSQVATDLVRGCSVAGYDATGQIRGQADRQSARLQERIDQSLPSIEPEMSALWEALHRPLALGPEACLVGAPERIAQSSPSLDGEALSLELSIHTKLTVLDRCTAEPPPHPPPLPAPGLADAPPPEAELHVVRRLPWGPLSDALTRTLATSTPPTLDGRAVRAVTARGALVPSPAGKPDRPRLALRLELDAGPDPARCRTRWWLADPVFDAAANVVRLRNAAPLGTANGHPLPASDEVRQWLEQQVALPAPPPLEPVAPALRAVVARAAQRRSTRIDVGVPNGEPRSSAVLVTAEALAVIATWPGKLPITVR